MSTDSPAGRQLAWRTSSYSQDNAACVEVAGDGDEVWVRDSKVLGGGPLLRIRRREWAGFLAEVTSQSR